MIQQILATQGCRRSEIVVIVRVIMNIGRYGVSRTRQPLRTNNCDLTSHGWVHSIVPIPSCSSQVSCNYTHSVWYRLILQVRWKELIYHICRPINHKFYQPFVTLMDWCHIIILSLKGYNVSVPQCNALLYKMYIWKWRQKLNWTEYLPCL